MKFKVKRVFTTKHPQTDEALYELYEAPDEASAIEAAKSKHPELVPSNGWFWFACLEGSDSE